MQRTTRSAIAALVATALLTIAAAPALAAPAPKPQEREDGAKYVLENGLVSVWFQGKKPMLKIFPSTSPGKDYSFTFQRVVEFQDLDANNVVAASEVRATVNLDRADGWRVAVDRGASEVKINLTLTAPVDLAGSAAMLPLPPAARSDAVVSLVFHVYGAPVEVVGHGPTLAVPTSAVKFDLAVVHWPWVSQGTDRLALEAEAGGAMERIQNGPVEKANVSVNGTNALGLLAWANTAEGRSGSANTTVPVVTTLSPTSANSTNLSASPAGSRTLVSWVFDAPSLDRIDYDPTIGLTDSAAGLAQSAAGLGSSVLKSVPAAPLVLGIAALAATALVTRRRR